MAEESLAVLLCAREHDRAGPGEQSAAQPNTEVRPGDEVSHRTIPPLSGLSGFQRRAPRTPERAIGRGERMAMDVDGAREVQLAGELVVPLVPGGVVRVRQDDARALPARVQLIAPGSRHHAQQLGGTAIRRRRHGFFTSCSSKVMIRLFCSISRAF